MNSRRVIVFLGLVLLVGRALHAASSPRRGCMARAPFFFGVVTLLFVPAAICVVSRGFASESTVELGGPGGQEAEPCTNALPHLSLLTLRPDEAEWVKEKVEHHLANGG